MLIGQQNHGDDILQLYPSIDLIDKLEQSNHVIWTKKSKFQGVWERSEKTLVCHFSFRILNYPDEQRFITKNKYSIDLLKRQFMYLYQLIYCAECACPVYWMCLPENQIIQKIYVRKQNWEYLVYICDVCVHIKQH